MRIKAGLARANVELLNGPFFSPSKLLKMRGITGILLRSSLVVGLIVIPWDIRIMFPKWTRDLGIPGWGGGFIEFLAIVLGIIIVTYLVGSLTCWIITGSTKMVQEIDPNWRRVKNPNVQWIAYALLLLNTLFTGVAVYNFGAGYWFAKSKQEAIWDLINVTIYILTLTIIHYGSKNRSYTS